MRLPFGLDFVSVLVGVLVAYFLIPWVLGFISRGKGNGKAATA